MTSVIGQTGVLAVTTSAQAIATNTAASNKIYRINALYISNLDTSGSYKGTVDVYRSTTAYPIVSAVSIPANSTLDVINKTIYLLEGDSLRVTADANSKLTAVCSWEEIS